MISRLIFSASFKKGLNWGLFLTALITIAISIVAPTPYRPKSNSSVLWVFALSLWLAAGIVIRLVAAFFADNKGGLPCSRRIIAAPLLLFILTTILAIATRQYATIQLSPAISLLYALFVAGDIYNFLAIGRAPQPKRKLSEQRLGPEHECGC